MHIRVPIPNKDTNNSKNTKTARKILTVLVFEIYFFSLKTKANPSPNGNGFAFNLFVDDEQKGASF